MRNRVPVLLLVLATSAPLPVLGVDRVVGVNAPSGGATLVRRVHVEAGTEVARIELVSNDVATTFPALRLRRSEEAVTGEVLAEATSVTPAGNRHRFTYAITPVVFADAADVLVEVVLPPTNGVTEIGTGAGLGALNLNGSGATSFIGSTATSELQAIDADLCVTLLGPASAGKAGSRPPQDPEPPATGSRGLSITVLPRLGGDPEIQITTSGSTGGSVEIFDVRGALVRTLSRGTVAAGSHRLVWDRRDVAGGRVAAGIYFVVARVGDAEAIRKTVVLH